MSEREDFDLVGNLSGLLSFTKSLTDGSMEESRKDIFRDKWENILVDTCCPPDSGKWETGIDRPRHGEGIDQDGTSYTGEREVSIIARYRLGNGKDES